MPRSTGNGLVSRCDRPRAARLLLVKPYLGTPGFVVKTTSDRNVERSRAAGNVSGYLTGDARLQFLRNYA